MAVAASKASDAPGGLDLTPHSVPLLFDAALHPSVHLLRPSVHPCIRLLRVLESFFFIIIIADSMLALSGGKLYLTGREDDMSASRSAK